MEVLNNNYATANLIRTGKVEQIYSQLQTKTNNRYDEKMITMERHLARLVKDDKIDINEAQKWANNLTTFAEAMNLE
jgi:Tfp pilus assembly pilus retraction ATPase PilT